MSQVSTIKGLIDRADLIMKPVIQEDENSVVVALEWYYRGELVRRSAHGEALRPVEMGASDGE